MSNQPKETKQNPEVPIPEGLQNQLDGFKKRLWQIKIAEAVLAGFFGLLFSFLLVFGLDRFIETPASGRLLILLVGVSLFTLFAPYWIHRWVYGHRRKSQLARLISRRFPRLGDRLLGAVELRNQHESKDSLSPELRAAAIRTVAAEAAARDLGDALPASRHRKWSLVVVSLFIVAVCALVSMPEAGVNALKRWLMPMSETERFTFTQLDLSGIPTPYHVPHGESFSFTVPLAKETSRRPEKARARYGNGEWIEASLKNNSYTFDFPGQRAQDIVRIEADDASYDLPFEPSMRPTAEKISATIKLPAYLERENFSVDLRSGFTTALEGSEVKIQATVSRALNSATAMAQILPKEESAPDLFPSLNDESSMPEDKSTPPQPSLIPTEQKIDVAIQDRNLTTDSIQISDSSLVIPLQWTDIHGLQADSPLKIRIESTTDQAPSTYIQGIERQHIILAKQTLSFEVLAEDDYGLKACGISWEGEFTKPSDQKPAKGEKTIQWGNPNQVTFNIPWKFSPANHNIAPQRLVLRSWTEDYRPGRGKIYSEPITIYILDKNEHAQVLKNEFDRAIGELEDIARKEQNLNDQNQRLLKQPAKDLQNEANQKQLQKQEDGERENKERMQELSKKMEQLFQDSVRNEQIDKDVLKKMSKALEAMKELAEQDLPKVERKLQDAQSQRNSAGKTKQDLKDAAKEQQKALEKMKQAIKDANEANREFEASTFVNRLKRAASEEDGIASVFLGMINEVIGSTVDALDPVQQRSIKSISTQQRQTAIDVRWIQEDLTHYYARTQKEEHKKLVEAMRKSRIDEAMEQLSSRVSDNISYTSIVQSKKWAEQLRKWAKELEGSGDSPGGGGGPGGGGSSPEDKDFEFMLKVMRMIQKEQDIRARTRELENYKRTLIPPKKESAEPSSN